MSESKFTPGPYLRDGACVYKLSKDGVNIFSVQVSSGYSDSGGRTSTEECEAVAQLMQVAPDLLSALIESRQVIATALKVGAPDWFDTDEKVAQHTTVKRIDAAIQRATASPMGKE